MAAEQFASPTVIPPGWAVARLGDTVTLVNGYPFTPSQWKRDGLPIVRIQNLNDPDAPFNYCSDGVPERFRIRSGDLLFAWSGTPGTSFGAHIWRGGDAWLNQHIFKVVFNHDLLNPEFLRLSINQNLAAYVAHAQGGSGLAHITKRAFESSYLLIAPLNEQHRIVAAVNELCAELEVAIAALERARQNIKRSRSEVQDCYRRHVDAEVEKRTSRRRAGLEAPQADTR